MYEQKQLDLLVVEAKLLEAGATNAQLTDLRKQLAATHFNQSNSYKP